MKRSISIMEKQMPQNIDAEKCLLACIISNGNILVDVMQRMKPDDFYRESHRIIYQTMMALHERQSLIDLLTLADLLEVRDKLKDVGGYSYLSEVTNCLNTANEDGSVDYATIIATKAHQRRLIHACSALISEAFNSEESEESLQNKAESLVYALRNNTHCTNGSQIISEIAAEYAVELGALHDNKQDITGTPTGLSDLDRLTGGLQRTDLVILAGRPAMGKTLAGLSWAIHAATLGYKVAVFSLEMSKKQLARRITAMMVPNDLNMQKLRIGDISDDQWDGLVETLEKMSGLPLWINDASGTPVSKIRADMRRLTQDYGQFDLIVVDYIGIMDSPESNNKNMNRAQEISVIAKGLKAVAKEFNLPVLALAQINRESERTANKKPQLSNLKESGAIEENADVVLLIHRDSYYASQAELENNPTMKNIASIIIAKHRNGETGELEVFYYGPKAIIGDLEKVLE